MVACGVDGAQSRITTIGSRWTTPDQEILGLASMCRSSDRGAPRALGAAVAIAAPSARIVERSKAGRMYRPGQAQLGTGFLKAMPGRSLHGRSMPPPPCPVNRHPPDGRG